MSIENRVEATLNNVEGKVQEVVGEVTARSFRSGPCAPTP